MSGALHDPINWLEKHIHSYNRAFSLFYTSRPAADQHFSAYVDHLVSDNA